MKRKIVVMSCMLFFVCLWAGNAAANKASVTIDGPETAENGSEVVIKLTVAHSGNNFFHHVTWLKAQANNKPVSEWNYTSADKPDGETFTKEIKIRVDADTEIVAEASCNIHGSAGPAKLKIRVSEPAAKP
jgi:desulfoferrodoxin (superoxide reductase-like protein)